MEEQSCDIVTVPLECNNDTDPSTLAPLRAGDEVVGVTCSNAPGVTHCHTLDSLGTWLVTTPHGDAAPRDMITRLPFGSGQLDKLMDLHNAYREVTDVVASQVHRPVRAAADAAVRAVLLSSAQLRLGDGWLEQVYAAFPPLKRALSRAADLIVASLNTLAQTVFAGMTARVGADPRRSLVGAVGDAVAAAKQAIAAGVEAERADLARARFCNDRFCRAAFGASAAAMEAAGWSAFWASLLPGLGSRGQWPPRPREDDDDDHYD